MRHFMTAIVAGALLAGAATLALAEEAANPHADHMTPEQFAELREKIPGYREISDDEIVTRMARMRDLGGMISDASVVGEIGVLVMSHGYNDRGNEQFMERVAPAAASHPTAYALGMAMMSSDHIQKAIDGLEAAGAKEILVLRAETGESTSLMRQWEYIFGRRDDSAYLSVPRVASRAEIIWGPTPTAHPIMAEIMLDHARALSVDPANELVVIIGHGPGNPGDNARELATLGEHARLIKERGGFSDVKYANVQDDAPVAVRAANVEEIRGWISAAKSQGRDVIVVTNVLTQSALMGRLEADVEGLGAKFNNTGLMQNPRFADWITQTIDDYASADAAN